MLRSIEIDSADVYKLTDDLYRASQKSVVEHIGAYMVQSTRDNFAANGRPDRWPDRADSTLSYNRKLSPRSAAFGSNKKTGDWPLLRKSGRMYASIDAIVADIPGGQQVTIGDHTSYGVYHHYGTRKMPMRRFLVIRDEDNAAIDNIIVSGFL